MNWQSERSFRYSILFHFDCLSVVFQHACSSAHNIDHTRQKLKKIKNWRKSEKTMITLMFHLFIAAKSYKLRNRKEIAKKFIFGEYFSIHYIAFRHYVDHKCEFFSKFSKLKFDDEFAVKISISNIRLKL